MLETMESRSAHTEPMRPTRRTTPGGDDRAVCEPPQAAAAGGQARKWRWGAAFIALTLVLLLLLRQPLADWLWPQTRAQRLRDQAAQALAEGRLTAPDGSGARELYGAALALDPDRIDAREGLNRVGYAALAQARAAMAHRQYPQAHRALELAEALSIPRAQIDATREQLRQHEAAATGIDALLKRAAAARAEGRLDGDDNTALPLYLHVLELQPDRTEALEGREDTLSDLLQQARALLAASDVAAASALVRRVQVADAGHIELPAALAELHHAAEQRRKRADRQLRAGRLAQALDGYRAALLVDPEDVEAGRGLIAVATAHARRSERLAADFRFGDAEAELSQAEAIAAQTATEVPAITQARQHLAHARQSQRQMHHALPPAQRRKRVARLLAEAAQAEARGDLLTPPGESAYDKLRSARALAPQDARVKAAAARLASVAKTCFTDAMRDNRLVRAGVCLDVRRALESDSAGVRAGRRELAQRWIAMGDQRLGAGEVEGARAALNAARALDPGSQGLNELASRLQVAAAASK